jgi:hypothetical protein
VEHCVDQSKVERAGGEELGALRAIGGAKDLSPEGNHGFPNEIESQCFAIDHRNAAHIPPAGPDPRSHRRRIDSKALNVCNETREAERLLKEGHWIADHPGVFQLRWPPRYENYGDAGRSLAGRFGQRNAVKGSGEVDVAENEPDTLRLQQFDRRICRSGFNDFESLIDKNFNQHLADIRLVLYNHYANHKRYP